jgi:hypothetical protein
MATITTTATNSRCRLASSCPRGIRPTSIPVGAEPARRTIAHSVGSYRQSGFTTNLSLRRSAATVAIPGSAMPRRSRAHSANIRPQCGLLQAIRPYDQQANIRHSRAGGNLGCRSSLSCLPLSLRRSTATVAIPGSAMSRRSRAHSANIRPQCGLLQAIRPYGQQANIRHSRAGGNPGCRSSLSCLPLSLRGCEVAVAISSLKTATKAHVASGPNKKYSAFSADLRDLCVQKILTPHFVIPAKAGIQAVGRPSGRHED